MRKNSQITYSKIIIFYFIESKPTIEELRCFTYVGSSGAVENVYIISAVGTRWKKLGRALNFTSEEISVIELRKNYRIEECCQELLQRWLDGLPGNQASITWETLLQAMAAAECITVTRQVWKALTGEGKSELNSAVSNSSLG